jgi:hypothetical protein
MPAEQPTLLAQRAMYVTLISLFVSLFLLFMGRVKAKRGSLALRPFELVLLGFATYRLGRLVSFDKVSEPLRQPFTQTEPDPTGVGETVAPKGTGMRRALGELLSCPICTGTWLAALLVYGLVLLPRVTHAFLVIMGAAGVAELLNAATEALQWTGQLARKNAAT